MKRALIVLLSVLTLISVVTPAFCVNAGDRVKLKGGYVVAASQKDYHKLAALDEKNDAVALEKYVKGGMVYWTRERAEVEVVNIHPLDGTTEVKILGSTNVVWTSLKAIGYGTDESFAKASVESGNWAAYKRLAMKASGGVISEDGPIDAYVNASSNVIDISLTIGNSTYRFHANVSGNNVSGTSFSSSSVGSFETPFSGQISGDGSRISIRPDWEWIYSGKRGKWVKNFDTSTTWTFIR